MAGMGFVALGSNAIEVNTREKEGSPIELLSLLCYLQLLSFLFYTYVSKSIPST